MNREQKMVVSGGLAGVAITGAMVFLVSRNISTPELAGTAERLAYALRWLVIAVLPLVAMIAAIGNARFLSEAIDPTRGHEDRAVQINCRVVTNTVEQFILFAIGLLALAVGLPERNLTLVPAVAIAFALARIAFWIGYRIDPPHRAAGFAGTNAINIATLGAALWLWLR